MGERRSPCRLTVLLATEARTAVVVRRGPSSWAHLSLWDRDTDSIEPGQWFRGRVYERRCDLSPDGRLFVYIGAKHGRPDSEVGEAWTAVSRPPYFTALALWENLGSWYGGGFFETNRRLLLDATCTLETHPDFPTPPLEIGSVPADSAPWEQRLLRDGWTLKERGFEPRNHRRVGPREVWCKPDPKGRFALYRQVEDWDPTRYGSPYWDTWWLETGDDLLPLPDVTWADFDGERLVFTRKGVLVGGVLVRRRARGAGDLRLQSPRAHLRAATDLGQIVAAVADDPSTTQWLAPEPSISPSMASRSRDPGSPQPGS